MSEADSAFLENIKNQIKALLPRDKRTFHEAAERSQAFRNYLFKDKYLNAFDSIFALVGLTFDHPDRFFIERPYWKDAMQAARNAIQSIQDWDSAESFETRLQNLINAIIFLSFVLLSTHVSNPPQRKTKPLHFEQLIL